LHADLVSPVGRWRRGKGGDPGGGAQGKSREEGGRGLEGGCGLEQPKEEERGEEKKEEKEKEKRKKRNRKIEEKWKRYLEN
jgi:hypothetical protein